MGSASMARQKCINSFVPNWLVSSVLPHHLLSVTGRLARGSDLPMEVELRERRIVGDMHWANRPMQLLAQSMGFTIEALPRDRQVRRLVQGHSSVNGIGLRRDAEAGWVVSPALQGKGYATEAVSAVVPHYSTSISCCVIRITSSSVVIPFVH